MKVKLKFSDQSFEAQQLTPGKIPHGVIKYCGKFIMSTDEKAPHNQIRVFYDDWIVKIGSRFLHFPPNAFVHLFTIDT